MILAWPQAQTDERTRVRYRFGLPAMVGLVTPHGIFTGLVPCTRGFAAEVVFANQGFLNGSRPLGVDLLLSAQTC